MSPYKTILLTSFSIKGSREVGSWLEGEVRVREFRCFKMGNITAHTNSASVALENDPVEKGNDAGERRKN